MGLQGSGNQIFLTNTDKTSYLANDSPDNVSQKNEYTHLVVSRYQFLILTIALSFFPPVSLSSIFIPELSPIILLAPDASNIKLFLRFLPNKIPPFHPLQARKKVHSNSLFAQASTRTLRVGVCWFFSGLFRSDLVEIPRTKPPGNSHRERIETINYINLANFQGALVSRSGKAIQKTTTKRRDGRQTQRYSRGRTDAMGFGN